MGGTGAGPGGIDLQAEPDEERERTAEPRDAHGHQGTEPDVAKERVALPGGTITGQGRALQRLRAAPAAHEVTGA